MPSGNKAAEGLNLPAPRDLTPEDDQKDVIFADADSQGSKEQPATATQLGGGEDKPEPQTTPEGPPTTEDVTDAEFVDVPPEELRNLEQNKDPELMSRTWFATVKGRTSIPRRRAPTSSPATSREQPHSLVVDSKGR